MQQACDTVGHEALLPSPDNGFAGAATAHDLGRAAAVCRQQDDLGTPDMLLRAVPICHNRLQAGAILGGDLDCDTVQHTSGSNPQAAVGILNRTQALEFIH